VSTVLDEILAEKRREVDRRRREVPIGELRGAVETVAPPVSLRAALASAVPPGAADREPRIIAEVKKASPSKGVIRPDFDPIAIASAYEAAGAAAISVLTDTPFFQGSLEYLRAIRERVKVPLLRKDFMIDPYQVWEARAAGADAILLILAAIPNDAELSALAAEARSLGMDVLWEVHCRDELNRVLGMRPEIIGINNRNLKTFEVSLETTRTLLKHVPPGIVTVSESGFFLREEIDRMRRWGVQAFLIGESLIRAPDPGEALRELLRPSRSERAS
jgi:indole-3-glycerol phosphate synthase